MLSKLLIACLTFVILISTLSRLAQAEQFMRHNTMGGSADADDY
jgi:hypothetical protein